jgi:hypothetical protein
MRLGHSVAQRVECKLCVADMRDVNEIFGQVILRRGPREPREQRRAASPLPDPHDVAAFYAESKFRDLMERKGCELGYCVGYATVSDEWARGDPLPDPWSEGSFREFALSLDGWSGVRWLEAYERGFKKGTIDEARQLSAVYPPGAVL